MMELIGTASQIGLWLLVVVQGFVLLELLRQVGILRERLGAEPGALVSDDGLARGTSAPPFQAVDYRSGRVVSSEQPDSRKTLLVFVSPKCVTCRTLAPDLPAFASAHRTTVRTILVCGGPRAECERFVAPLKLAPVLIDPDLRISKDYQVSVTPSATVIDADGAVLIQGIPRSVRDLDGLLDEEGTPAEGRQWTMIPESELTGSQN